MSRSSPTEPPRGLTRRQLLRSGGLLGATGLLAACAGGSRPSSQAPATTSGTAGPSSPQGATPTGDVRQAILDELGIDAPLDLNVALPIFEFVPGENQHFLFGLQSAAERKFLNDLDVEVTLVRDRDFSVVTGPTAATRYQKFGQFTVYGAELTYPEPGVYRAAIAGPEHAGVAALQVTPPDQTTTPQVGTAFPSAPTATRDNKMGLNQLCTRDPDCSMHQISLDTAMEEGRPVALTVATPEFCQTAICGPVVDVIEGVKQQAGRDDVAWIHAEVFKDAGNTPVELISTLGLPSEPWTFFVGADGMLVDRLQGPTPAPLVSDALAKL